MGFDQRLGAALATKPLGETNCFRLQQREYPPLFMEVGFKSRLGLLTSKVNLSKIFKPLCPQVLSLIIIPFLLFNFLVTNK